MQKTQIVLDEIDNIILYLVCYGGGSLAYLSRVLDLPKSTLSNRVQRLEQIGLLESVNNKEKHAYRKYVILPDGHDMVISINLISNALLLQRNLRDG